jgi:hypothetical protein
VSQFLPLLFSSAILLCFKNCFAILLCFKNCSAILLYFMLFLYFSLLHAILLFFSCFCLFSNYYSSLIFISSSATFNFTLLTIHHIFPVRTTNLTQSLHVSFYSHTPHQLHLKSSWEKTPQKLNHQLIKNHESVLLTES